MIITVNGGTCHRRKYSADKHPRRITIEMTWISILCKTKYLSTYYMQGTIANIQWTWHRTCTVKFMISWDSQCHVPKLSNRHIYLDIQYSSQNKKLNPWFSIHHHHPITHIKHASIMIFTISVRGYSILLCLFFFNVFTLFSFHVSVSLGQNTGVILDIFFLAIHIQSIGKSCCLCLQNDFITWPLLTPSAAMITTVAS